MCGIIAVYNHPDAAIQASLGLYEMQHRGEESAGCASTKGDQLFLIREMGKVEEVLTVQALKQLPGNSAIGHTRYSTAGDSVPANAQPIKVECKYGLVAVAHNGNITNARVLRRELELQGAIFHSSSDTEIVLQLITHSRQPSFLEALKESIVQLAGAFSLVFLTPEGIIAVRDSHGFRPLALGKTFVPGTGTCYVLASETCAFKHSGAKYEREVAPGEIILITKDGLRTEQQGKQARAQCSFEHVYFARPDSMVFNRSVTRSREMLGALLFKECPADGDIVVAVPDSGVIAALGYSIASGKPLKPGLQRSHYTGRSFIAPKQASRERKVNLKLTANEYYLKGQRVILIDDSIVRGTTSKIIIGLIRAAGAKEVHLRITCPPTTSPCFYGVDTPSPNELIGATSSIEEIRKFVKADSLGYLSHDSLKEAVGDEAGDKNTNFCYACYTGQYPMEAGNMLVQIS